MDKWLWNGIFFFNKDEGGNADGGGNSGGEEDNGKPGDGGQDNNPPVDKPKDDDKPVLSFKTQKEVDDFIEERLKRDRKTREESEKEKARKEAGEFKPLYEELKKKYDEEITPELTSQKEKLAARDKRLNEIIDGEIKDWDESIKSMDPGPEDVDSRSRWLEKARPAAEKLKSSGIAPNLDHGRKGGGGGTDAAKSYVKGQYEVPESISGKK